MLFVIFLRDFRVYFPESLRRQRCLFICGRVTCLLLMNMNEEVPHPCQVIHILCNCMAFIYGSILYDCILYTKSIFISIFEKSLGQILVYIQ